MKANSLMFQLDVFMRDADRLALAEKLERELGRPVCLLPPYVRVKEKPILYTCDRRACETCSPECRHTADISHAANFEKTPAGSFIERNEG